MNNSTSTNLDYETSHKNHTYEITIIGILFFIFGFVTWVNGSLIAYLKIACELNNTESFLVVTAFFIAYFVMALPSAWILQQIGYKKGMVLGLAVMAVGAIIFVPAANTRIYSWFLAGLFVIGTGLTILQAAVNPYVTVLGPRESAAQRISIMGICNKIAGGIGTFVLGAILLVNLDKFKADILHLDPLAKAQKLNELASRVVVPYLVIAVVLVILALLVMFSKLPEIDTEEEDEALTKLNSGKKTVFEFPNLVLGVISLFLYVGVEVLAGDSIINFGVSQNIPLETARFFTIYTLLAMVFGYILWIVLIPKYVKQDMALRFSAILGLCLTGGIIFTQGIVSISFLALLGFANAIMWPAMWPLALEGIGRFTKIGSALLIMAIAGGAIIPLGLAKFFDIFPKNTQFAYWVAIPCYAYILYYAIKGHKIKTWSN
jgi:MFS transporter, FHS family, L-fucose permease